MPTLRYIFAFAAPLTALALCTAPATAADNDGWVELFNGQDLAGWTQRNGTAKYWVEDGAIVGRTTEGSPNSFLCTDGKYGDFDLTFEVKLDNHELNSGVQIRSKTEDDKPENRVNGPQVEIEASNPNHSVSGYIYGESAGGWMTPDSDRKPHSHFKRGEWNKYRVKAEGKNIKVWINDELVSDLDDEEKLKTHPQGFIGLQVHGVNGDPNWTVRWRNIKLKEL